MTRSPSRDLPHDLLGSYGLTPEISRQVKKKQLKTGQLGRIIRSHKVGYDVITETGIVFVEAIKKQRDPLDMPVTGDWILLERHTNHEHRRLLTLFSRDTALIRRDPADRVKPQVLAANIGVIAIVHGADRPVNARKLARALVISEGSGAQVVVVQTKTDLDVQGESEAALRQAVPFHHIVITSSERGDGIAELHTLSQRYGTLALLGESGAGKTTLVNALTGKDTAQTGAVRSTDNKGRHTTTHRQIHPLANGGSVYDTPGIRAIGVWPGAMSVDRAFPEISKFALGCYFDNCTHHHEPGCNVLEALAAGEINQERFDTCMQLVDEEAELMTLLEQVNWT